VILTSTRVGAGELERRTGWELKPQGACKGELCVPLEKGTTVDGTVDVEAFARQLGMPLVHDEGPGMWALGPRAGGRALTTAAAPELELPDLEGNAFSLDSLRGQKVVLAAWASW
jgi:hypothetical protein